MLKLSPITLKRFERFKNIKRAYYSFWILVIAFILSLGANLYCNNVPYLVVFKNKYYFPIFKDYVLSDFLENAPSSPINYKEFERTEDFLNDPNRKIIYPPIPYGAEENIPIQILNLPKDVYVTITKEPIVGSLDISEELIIKKAESPEYFFQPEQEYKKQALSQFMSITPELMVAIENRFKNMKSIAFQTTVKFNQNDIKISLLEYEPEELAPSKIRLRLTRISSSIEKHKFEQTIQYNEIGKLVSDQAEIWSFLTEEQKQEWQEKLQKRLINFVDPMSVEVQNLFWNISFNRKEAFYPSAPIRSNPMGFTESGRDVLAQMIYGFRTAISFGLLLVTFTMLIGAFIGGLQGYFAGKVDLTVQRVLEIWASLPFLYIMIYLGNIYGRGFLLLLIIYGVFNWIGISYYMRAEFLRLRKTGYVEAAKCMGISNLTIMLKHILPNALVPIVTFFPFSLVAAIDSLTVLDYLGFGLPPGTPSWGSLMAEGNAHVGSWWLIFYPSLALFLVMMLGTLIGDGLRAAFDPRKFYKIE